jgi:hypothetical protein
MLSSDAVRSPLDGVPGRALEGDDSRSPTLPDLRAKGREIPSEVSGKRVRPDATVRGLGPDATTIRAEAAPTMDVSNSEVDIVTDAELQMSWMRRDYRFLGGALAGGLLLVVAMLLMIARDDASEAAPPQELGAVEQVVAPALPVAAAAVEPSVAEEPPAASAAPAAKLRPKALRAGSGRLAKGKPVRAKAKGKATAQRKKKARLKASAALR